MRRRRENIPVLETALRMERLWVVLESSYGDVALSAGGMFALMSA